MLSVAYLVSDFGFDAAAADAWDVEEGSDAGRGWTHGRRGNESPRFRGGLRTASGGLYINTLVLKHAPGLAHGRIAASDARAGAPTERDRDPAPGPSASLNSC